MTNLPRRGYALLVAATALVAAAGYMGYALYPRFGLPGAEGPSLLLLAAAAGVASFFSPCAFPLLVTLLARETGAARPRGVRVRAAAFGLALAAGAAAFLLLLGAGIALGGGALFRDVTFTSTAGIVIRFSVGALLILLGLVQLDVLPSPLAAAHGLGRPFLRAQARLRRRSPAAGFAVLGFGYLLAGFG